MLNVKKLKGPAIAGLLCLAGCGVYEQPSEAQPAAYDPSPLTEEEHNQVLSILDAEGKIEDITRFSRLSVAPEDKSSDVHPRQAEIIVRNGMDTIQGVVDIDAGSVDSWDVIDGAHAPWLMEEYFNPVVMEKLFEHPDFLAALEARGIEDSASVRCMFTPPAFFGETRFDDVRLAVARCFPTGTHTNKYPQRIEGLQIFADMNALEIFEVNDYQTVPSPDTVADYDRSDEEESRSFPTPIRVDQPEGPAFSLDGDKVEWEKWRFRIRSDQRVGIVISDASWQDGDELRSVLNEGHLSEISVPYMAPQGDWYLRSPIDAGEYSAGGLSDPLVPGVHCPTYATFMDGLITGDTGEPQVKENVICVFERVNGDPTWLHDVEGRQDRSLVARMAARLGNYDYLVDWVFSADGQIQVRLGATGIVATMNTVAADATTPGADRYGRFVDEHVKAINHSHYFSFRMDLDVDGEANDFRLGHLSQTVLDDESPRKTIWEFSDMVLETEADARLDGHGMWRVASSESINSFGYPTSYQIMPGMNASPIISADDWPRSRAGFVDHQMWVTQYKPAERFAAGDFPTQSQPGEGLPEWSTDEPIAGEDIVVWYTMGMHHVVRAEDWPVMPVLWHDVTLRPFDFFDRNAALTLERTD